MSKLRTNFSLCATLSSHQHRTTAIRHQTRAAEEVAAQRLARFHCLDGQVLSHRFGNGITIFAALDALLCKQLDFRSSNFSLTSTHDPHLRIKDLPVLKPDLDRAFSHVNILRDSFSDCGRRCGILVEFHLQRH